MYTDDTIKVIKYVDELFNKYINNLKNCSSEKIIDNSEETLFYLELSSAIKSFAISINNHSTLKETIAFSRLIKGIDNKVNILEENYNEYISHESPISIFINSEIHDFIENIDKFVINKKKDKLDKLREELYNLIEKDYVDYMISRLTLDKSEIIRDADNISNTKKLCDSIDRKYNSLEYMSENLLERSINAFKNNSEDEFMVVEIANHMVNELGDSSFGGSAFSQNLAECMNELFK